MEKADALPDQGTLPLGDDSQTQTCVTPSETFKETFCSKSETCPGSQEWGCRATVDVGDNNVRLRHLALVASFILSLFYRNFCCMINS